MTVLAAGTNETVPASQTENIRYVLGPGGF